MQEPTTPAENGRHPWPPIGENLARLRTLAGLTQEQLAERAGVSVDVVRRLEQGSRPSARITSLYALAGALDVPLSVLLAHPNVLAGEGTRPGHEGVLALRAALMPVPGSGQDAEPMPLAALGQAAQETWRRYRQANDFTGLVALLPGLVASGQATAAAQPAAWRPLAEIYTVAAEVTTQLGYEDLGYHAVQHARAAAERTSDPVTIALTGRTLSWILLRQGRLEDSVTVALRTADEVEPRFGRAAPGELVAYGGALWLALTGVARQGRADDAEELLRLLQATATRLGRDDADPTYAFGPTVAAAKAVSTAVELGEYGRAIELASSVPRKVTAPQIYARYLLDLAQAQCRAQRLDDALATMLETRRLAREWLRYQVLAREIARALWAKWPRGRRRPDGLRQLAEELNVLD